MNPLILKQIIGNIIPNDVRLYILHPYIYSPGYSYNNLRMLYELTNKILFRSVEINLKYVDMDNLTKDLLSEILKAFDEFKEAHVTQKFIRIWSDHILTHTVFGLVGDLIYHVSEYVYKRFLKCIRIIGIKVYKE